MDSHEPEKIRKQETNACYKMINCHIHTFKSCDIPDNFLPLKLVRWLASKNGFKWAARFLNWFNWTTTDDQFKKYIQFIRTGNLPSQKAIFDDCKKFYPKNTLFAVLTMDMSQMGCGKVPRPYIAQVTELSKIDGVIPFLCCDPRNTDLEYIFDKAFSVMGYKGVKLYPALGYYPDDPRLNFIYEYCNLRGIPVTAHGSPANPVHFKGSYSELYKLVGDRLPDNYKKLNRKELCAIFTDPENYRSLCEKYPNINFNIAHFGSAEHWEKFLNGDIQDNWFCKIKDMIEQIPNFYTDISYTLSNRKFFPLLKILLADPKINRKILFGSDYYMVECESDERRFSVELRAYIGEDNWKLIAEENPKDFMKI